MTASARRARSSRSGENSRDSATSSATGSSASGSVTSIAAVCSSNRRDQALRPVSAFSARIRSSGLGQQVRPVAARRAQVVAAEVEPVGGEQLLGALVVERGPLELEEQQRGLDLRAALLHALEQRAALGVGGGGREVQHRVGAGAADELLQRGELAHRRGEAGAVELGDLAGVGGGERVGAALRLVEQRSTPAAPSPGAGVPDPRRPSSTSGSATSGAAMRGDYDARSPSSMIVR